MSPADRHRRDIEAPVIEATNLLVAVYRMHEIESGDPPTFLLVSRALEALFEMRKALGLTGGETCPLDCTGWRHLTTDAGAAAD
jgi:hypothetical protein